MPQSIDDLKQQQKLEESKTATLNAQIERIRAERAFEKEKQVQAPSSADFSVPASDYKGEVRTDAKAGGIESSLLAARALTLGSQRIATKLKPVLDPALAKRPAGTSVLVFDTANIPTFQTYVAYKTQYEIVQKAMTTAVQALYAVAGTSADLVESSSRLHVSGTAGAIAPRFVSPAMAGLALESLDQLLGFFRTDYSVQGVDVKFADNIPLLSAIAGQLSADKYKVQIPMAYSAPADLATDPIFAEITALADLYTSLREAVADRERELAATAEPTPSSSTAQPNEQAASSSSAVKDALAFAESAQALYNGFYARLISSDDKGQLPLDTIVRQNSVRNLLQKGSPLLAVRIENAGGSYYTRRNLWSFFGGMPFFNMGGVVISYSLFEGDTGRLLASGTVPVDGGFVRISNLPAALAK